MDKDYISWDEYFMGVALLSAKRSKDPNTKVGACIVNQKKRIVGIGYNGLPCGCDDLSFPWVNDKSINELDTKYPYVVHAELNAILNAPTTNLKNCKIYVTLFPCCECAKAILQSGIKEVYYIENKHPNDDTYIAAKILFEKSNILVQKLEKTLKNI